MNKTFPLGGSCLIWFSSVFTLPRKGSRPTRRQSQRPDSPEIYEEAMMRNSATLLIAPTQTAPLAGVSLSRGGVIARIEILLFSTSRIFSVGINRASALTQSQSTWRRKSSYDAAAPQPNARYPPAKIRSCTRQARAVAKKILWH